MPESTFKSAISEIVKVTKKYHLSYDQFSYVTKNVRKNLKLEPSKTPSRTIDRFSKEEQNILLQVAYNLKGTTGLLVKTLT